VLNKKEELEANKVVDDLSKDVKGKYGEALSSLILFLSES